MALEEMDAYRAKLDEAEDNFLLKEGFDLLAAFRAIRSDAARTSILTMIVAIGTAEREAARSVES